MVAIHVGSQVKFTPSNWTVAHCPKCQRFEAIKLGKWEEVMSVWFFPVSRIFMFNGGICDWCETIIRDFTPTGTVAINEWSPSDGIATLFGKCAAKAVNETPRFATKEEINTLLDFVTKRTQFSKVGVGWATLFGVIIGLAIAFGVIYKYAAEVNEPGVLRVVSIIFGVIGGVAIGGCFDGYLRGRTKARNMIEKAMLKYGINSETLAELARDYPSRIQNAIKKSTNQDIR